MIERAGDRLRVVAPMTMCNAGALFSAGQVALAGGGSACFDLAQVGQADSTAVATMLGWLRSAAQSRSTVTFANIPRGVEALAELYGVADLLPRA